MTPGSADAASPGGRYAAGAAAGEWNDDPAQRAVLMLRGQQELDPKEVCALLDMSEGNMRVLLHRARVSIRNALDQLNKSL